MPWRIAACRIGSSRSTLKVLPLGWTVTVKGMGIGSRGAEARRLDSARDFARLPPRPPKALGARRLAAAVTDRPTRFKRPVLLIVGCGDVGLRVAAPARRPLARAGADVERQRASPSCAPPASLPLRRRPRPAGDARPPRRPRRRRAASRAAAGDGRRRSAHAHLAAALAQVAAPAPPRLRLDQRRLRRLRRRAHRRDPRRRGRRPSARAAASMPRRACATSAAPAASPSRCCAFPASTRSIAPAAIRASASRAARRCSPPATTSTPTTSMPTTWRAPASPRCIAAGRSASSTSPTTAS